MLRNSVKALKPIILVIVLLNENSRSESISTATQHFETTPFWEETSTNDFAHSEASAEDNEDKLCICANNGNGNVSFLDPLLNEFYNWVKSKNYTRSKFSAAFLQVITKEHEILMQSLSRTRSLMESNAFDENKGDLLYLKELRQNLTAEKADIEEELKTFDTNLGNTYRRVGCSGSFVGIVDGKFCRNGQWVYLSGSRVGKAEDIKLEKFRLSRLKLYGQLWNIKSAGGRVAVIEIPQSTGSLETTIKNIKDIQDISFSVNISIILDIPRNKFVETMEHLEKMEAMPGLIGINIALNSESEIDLIHANKIADIRSHFKLLLFSVSIPCSSTYNTTRDCVVRNCADWNCRHSYCLIDSTIYSTDSRIGDACPSPKSSFFLSKNLLKKNFDFIILKHIHPNINIQKLKTELGLPVVFQGIMMSSPDYLQQFSGFLVDEEGSEKSNTLKVIKTVKGEINKLNYEDNLFV
ncbi:uncharacterized protein LOC136041057 [Artemia franciscana]|uniref:uncharacterized protein LOC136041057 n=1 Tax=Artemia franciscana TaxID=6661 RepID=UPI0032DA1CAA